MFTQHDQLYTWAAVNQPPHSLDLCEGKQPIQIKGPWPQAKPGGDNRNGLEPAQSGKNSTALQCNLQFLLVVCACPKTDTVFILWSWLYINKQKHIITIRLYQTLKQTNPFVTAGFEFYILQFLKTLTLTFCEVSFTLLIVLQSL